MVQLDALRALAVTLVMIEHFFPSWFTKYISTGAIGVRMFFVLSGFLITGILLRCRRSDRPVWFSLRQFYTRRFLRIFPLFYFALALAGALASGAKMLEAAALANRAAGVVVGKVGTATATAEELLETFAADEHG